MPFLSFLMAAILVAHVAVEVMEDRGNRDCFVNTWRSNYVLKGSLKLQWILREEVIFCVKSLCLGAVHCSITLTILTNTVIKTTA